MRVFLVCLLLMASLSATVAAEEWKTYANDRFGYAIELPPGFAVTEEAANGDGVTLSTEDGQATLYVFAAYMTEGDFTAEITERIRYADIDDGWKIDFKRIAKTGASYSGTLAGRVLYGRGVPLCDGAVAYFQLEYPEARHAAYDPIVKHLVDSLKPSPGCRP